MRTKGAKNIKSFSSRTTVDTSTTADVKHLASISGNPLKHFISLLSHQANFLNWIDSRHDTISTLKKEILELKQKTSGKGPKGGKEATFVKYRWYAEHLALLAAINAFEVFYKTTFTGLATILQPFVQPEADRVVSINARLLWGITGGTAIPALVPTLVFEHLLFHDLDEVDRATDLLIGKRRYNRKQKSNPLSGQVKTLRGIFQVRHTLSHNNGMVTKSDHAKFKELGFTISQGEVIDPVKSSLGIGILKDLESEATLFTEWLRKETSLFLKACIQERGVTVPISKRNELETLLGVDPCWAAVTWT